MLRQSGSASITSFIFRHLTFVSTTPCKTRTLVLRGLAAWSRTKMTTHGDRAASFLIGLTQHIYTGSIPYRKLKLIKSIQNIDVTNRCVNRDWGSLCLTRFDPLIRTLLSSRILKPTFWTWFISWLISCKSSSDILRVMLLIKNTFTLLSLWHSSSTTNVTLKPLLGEAAIFPSLCHLCLASERLAVWSPASGWLYDRQWVVGCMIANERLAVWSPVSGWLYGELWRRVSDHGERCEVGLTHCADCKSLRLSIQLYDQKIRGRLRRRE